MSIPFNTECAYYQSKIICLFPSLLPWTLFSTQRKKIPRNQMWSTWFFILCVQVQQFACCNGWEQAIGSNPRVQLQMSLGKKKNRSLICRTQLPFTLILPREYRLKLRHTAKQYGIDLRDTQGKLCRLTVMRSHVYSTPKFCFQLLPISRQRVGIGFAPVLESANHVVLGQQCFYNGKCNTHDRHSKWIQLLKR